MKKLFLIPLLACFSCVMAWAEDAHVSNIADLKSAITNASVGTIYLDADIEYTDDTQGNQLNIARSLTIDGQGHTLSGYGKRTSSVYNIFSINNGGGSAMVDVVFKDLNMIITKNTVSNDRLARVIETRGNIHSIELNNVTIGVADYTKTYAVGLQIGGSQASKATLIITNSTINVGNPGYPVLSWNPYDMTATNSEFAGYCGLYFKGVNGSTGSRGSIVNADACSFECPNVYSGATNAFSCFPMADDGITLNLHNCGINNKQIGDQNQAFLTTGNDGLGTNRHAQAINVNISGDNSHINVGGGMNKTFQNLWGYNTSGYASKDYNDFADINITITGGTYSVHPQSYDMAAYGHWIIEDDQITSVNLIIPEIPATHEVQEIQQGAITLYRVVKKAATYVDPVTSEVTLYDLNDDVPTDVAGEGINPATSFELSTGGTMELDEDREVTKAGYVQVKDNEDTGNATVVKVGTTETADPTQKVDQTLLINNGLDVQGESQVIVQAGSTLQIGEGGINTEKPENIIIEADETGAASLLLDPTITVNQTPNLTVRMSAKQIGRNAAGDFYWHRFAMPVAATITSWDKEGTLVAADPEYTVQYPTYIYGWNYEENKWKNLPGVSSMVPLQGYTLTLASDYIHLDGAGKVVSEGTAGGNLNALQDVVYTFKGNLVGNTPQPLNFQAEGFNFFGNSYTGYMDVLKLIEGIQSNNVEGTVYMWCNDPDDEDGNYQSYVGVPLYKLSNAAQRARLADWQKEVSPMQTFILRLRGADRADENVNYAAAIWGNPRYGNTTTSSPAPRRAVAAINEDTYMEIAVKAANGKGSRVDFTESVNNSDDFESGYDVVKYMNEKSINLYATINGEDFSSVVTNNLIGKKLSLQTNGEIAYTMSFKNVEGVEYAIRDNATNQVIAIEEGVTYEFAAQPNSVIEGRFEIVDRANAPTAIENTEVKANVKGIYTIMGQYLGEDFDILPAGVYVVDGVKIVK